MSRDGEERQRAFTGLLVHPVVDRGTMPELLSLVRRHRVVLAEWCASRLGYRLLVTESAARLFRLPLDDTVSAPPRYRPPSRRVLVLALLAAAAAEDTEDVTTTQDLSQRVRAITQHEDVDLAAFDPDLFVHRLQFVKAVEILAGVGAVRPTSVGAQQQGESWAHRRNAVGGAFEVQREMLLRLVDPGALRAAVDPQPGTVALPESAARFGLLRKLLELPTCYIADLTEAERVYLTSQRQRVLAWCSEMTGWVAEQRTEGIALIAADEQETDLPFPRTRALDFLALVMLDELLRTHAIGAAFDTDALARAGSEVSARWPNALTNELKEPGALEQRSAELLTALDLIRRVGLTSWRIMPAAARFRNPKLQAVTVRMDEGRDE